MKSSPTNLIALLSLVYLVQANLGCLISGGGWVGVLVVVVNQVIHGVRNGLGARERERGDARGITCRQQGLLYGNRQNTPCCEQGYCEGRPHEGEFEVVGDEMPRGQPL